MTQVAAYKREFRFLRFYIFEFTDAFYRFVIRNVTAQCINRICRINDNASVFQAIHDQGKCLAVWIGVVYSEEHGTKVVLICSTLKKLTSYRFKRIFYTFHSTLARLMPYGSLDLLTLKPKSHEKNLPFLIHYPDHIHLQVIFPKC